MCKYGEVFYCVYIEAASGNSKRMLPGKPGTYTQEQSIPQHCVLLILLPNYYCINQFGVAVLHSLCNRSPSYLLTSVSYAVVWRFLCRFEVNFVCKIYRSKGFQKTKSTDLTKTNRNNRNRKLKQMKSAIGLCTILLILYLTHGSFLARSHCG